MDLTFKSCNKCILGQQYVNIATFSDGSKGNVIAGSGHQKALLAVVGDSPNISDYKNGIPFSSESGKGIRKAIEYWMGLNNNNVFYTYLIKCLCPDNKAFRKEAKEVCRDYVEEQLNQIDPIMVMLVGSEPAKTFLELDSKTKMSDVKGKLIRKDRNYFTVWSTGYIKKNKKKFDEWARDFKKARHEFDTLLVERFPQIEKSLPIAKLSPFEGVNY